MQVHIVGYILQCVICHVFNCWLVCQCIPFTYAIEIFGPSFDFAFLFVCAFTVSYMLQTTTFVRDMMEEFHWYGRSNIVNQAQSLCHHFDKPDSEDRTNIMRNLFYYPMQKTFGVALFTVYVNIKLHSDTGYCLYVGCLSATLLFLAGKVWTTIDPNTRDNINSHVKVWSALLTFICVMFPHYGPYMVIVGLNVIVEISRVIILRFLFYFILGPFLSGLAIYVSFFFKTNNSRRELWQLAHAFLATIWRFEGADIYGSYVIKLD